MIPKCAQACAGVRVRRRARVHTSARYLNRRYWTHWTAGSAEIGERGGIRSLGAFSLDRPLALIFVRAGFQGGGDREDQDDERY